MTTNFNFIEVNYVSTNDFNFGQSFVIYKILAGTSNNFVAIWADPTANLNTAKFYVGTTGVGAAFSAVDLQHKVLYDSYTISDGGQNKEPLEREDIVDINVRA
jgi:hypothetical protein